MVEKTTHAVRFEYGLHQPNETEFKQGKIIKEQDVAEQGSIVSRRNKENAVKKDWGTEQDYFKD